MRRGATYRYLVVPGMGDHRNDLGATPAAMDVIDAIMLRTRRPSCLVPVRAHVLAGALAVVIAVGLRLANVAIEPTACWLLPTVGALALVGLAVVEGKRLQPDLGALAAAAPVPWSVRQFVVGGAVCLVLVAAGVACWPPLWPVDREACAVVTGLIVGTVGGLQVLMVLWARRWFCRRTAYPATPAESASARPGPSSRS